MSREIYIDNLGLEHEISGTVAGASSLPYYNGTSGLSATTVQGAVDELASEKADQSEVDEKLFYINTISNVPIASFNDGGDNIPLKSLIANITAVQSGSGTPSPSNIRVISGWNGANVVKAGKNIFNGQALIDKGATYSSGVYTIPQNTAISKLALPMPPKAQLKVSYQGKYILSAVDYYLSVEYTDGTRDRDVSSGTANTWKTYSITTNPDKEIDGIYLRYYYNASQSELKDIQIEVGDAATTYEPYKGTTHTIPFGQTVYGGTLDVLNGVLTVTHYYISDLSQLTFYFESPHTFRATPPQFPALPADNRAVCSCYASFVGSLENLPDKSAVISGGGSYIFIRIRDDDYTDVTAFKNSLSGQGLVYKLATPVTYQLTPAQVKTLLGLNTIFADTGDISLSYFTQNANAINDIAESNTRTALNTDVPKTDLTDIFVTGTKNNTGSTIAAGTYFYVNGQLALCKSAISANADLTLNTNYELVTAGALNSTTLYKTGDTITLANTGMLATFETATELRCFFNIPKKIETSANLTINITYAETYIEGYDVNQTAVVSSATVQIRSDYQIVIKVNGNFTNVSLRRPVIAVLSGTITIS